MLVAALRQRILELAIQGKLVPQSPEDGNADELYQQIQLERKKLIAAGKLKKEKPLPPIKEEEILFDIPKSWKWVRFGDIVINRDSERIPLSTAQRSKLKKNYDYYGASGVIDKVEHYLFDAQLLLIGEDGANLLTRSKPIAFIAKGKYWVNNHAHVLDAGKYVSLEYLELFVNAISLVPYVTGSAQPKMNQARMNTIPVSLPPLAEQKRIVAKVGALFAELDAIEQSQERAAAIQAELNKRILERAIQGKLVPQCPEEGTAEDLYQQIQREKKKLIAAGKLKKEKPLPPTSEDEMPFDIPDSWKWVRLGELGVFERGAGIKKSEVVKEGLPCVRYGQLYTTYKESFSDAVSYVPEELFTKCKQANKGDILMALTGENKPDIALAVVYEGENPLAIGGDMTRFTPIHVNSHYLMKVINSPHGIAQKVKTATGDIIVHTSNDKLAAMLIPLPPPAEQERIIHKIADLNVNI